MHCSYARTIKFKFLHKKIYSFIHIIILTKKQFNQKKAFRHIFKIGIQSQREKIIIKNKIINNSIRIFCNPQKAFKYYFT